MIKKWNDFVNENIDRDIFSQKFDNVTTTDSEMIECPECKGNGEFECNNCDGRGSTYCEECRGDGYIEDMENEYVDCYYCNGTGNIDCEECNSNGYERCANCNGYGEIDSEDDYSPKGVTDLSLELEYKLRTLEDDAEYDFDDFFGEFGVKNPTDFATAAILKGREEYKDMSDDEFFELYKNSKDNG